MRQFSFGKCNFLLTLQFSFGKCQFLLILQWKLCSSSSSTVFVIVLVDNYFFPKKRKHTNHNMCCYSLLYTYTVNFFASKIKLISYWPVNRIAITCNMFQDKVHGISHYAGIAYCSPPFCMLLINCNLLNLIRTMYKILWEIRTWTLNLFLLLLNKILIKVMYR